MTHPDDMTRGEWDDAYAQITARVEPWLVRTPDGSLALDPDNTPGLLAQRFGRLTEVGLEHGWLTLEQV